MNRTSTQWVKRLISCTIPLLSLTSLTTFGNSTVVPVHIVFYEDLLKGKVTDENGQPLPGVSVRYKHNGNAVQTDAEGRFSIVAQPGKTTLVFSFIGYKTREVTITGGLPAEITLQTDPTSLHDVVVLGYQSLDRKNTTQAAVRVRHNEELRAPANSFDQLMTGHLAGVNVINSSGLVGERVAIRVRGASSISSSSSSNPLIVIDGVPVLSGNSATLSYNPINALSSINPADIESIQVLKDAAAAAIYGSRAAAGVLLVTTKKGKAGAGNITYSADLGLVKPGNKLDVLNAESYNTTINQMRTNAGLAPLAAYEQNTDGSDKVVDTDWQDILFHDGGVQQHQLSFSGGSDKYNYYGSGNYYNYDNYLRNNTLQRISGRLNASAKVKEWLTAGLNMQYSRAKQLGFGRDAGTNVNAMPRSFMTYFPNVRVYNDDGSYYHGRGGNGGVIGGANYPNPLATLEQNRDDQETRRFIGSMYLEATPVKGLTVKSQFNTDLVSGTETVFWHPRTPDGTTAGFNGISFNAYSNFNTWAWYTTAQYKTLFGADNEHSLSVLAGMEFTRRRAKSVQPYGYGLKDPQFTYLSVENYTTFGSAAGFMFNDGLASYFASANYSYKDKYIAALNLRADYNSNFIGNNQRGLFPAVSAGWRLSEEDFLKHSYVVNDLKLRASYGLTGNASVGYFPALATYQTYQYGDLTAINISTAGNAALKWEKSGQANIGADASLLSNRLHVTTDWFVKTSKDLILQSPVLSTAGMPNNSLAQNIGKLRTTGTELSLSGSPVLNSKWWWTSDFNISYIKNKVLATNANGDPLFEGMGIAKPGEELGTFNLLRFKEVDAATGRAVFLDKDGNAKMYNPANASWTNPETGQAVTAISGTDKVALSGKTPYPKFQGGFFNTLGYGDWEVRVGLQYAFGYYVYNQTLASLMDQTNAYNKSTEILEAWSKSGQPAEYPALYWGDNQSMQESSLWLEKAGFLRVREITLAYNVPATLLKRAKMDRVRVYVQAQNPFLFTSYKGMDPEANATGNTNIGLGIDSFRPFMAKTFMAGITISL
ncbi:SusC/RagA family TonB-linked outer membrane protein [uncultured Chitinophaga sp.]|uniref:SusC/RagA family TonB-linked outer membrane protein n=1 Tax=uncultured Chitinophaga sp. TaxID=339340 RepID=UPI0025D1DE59|nr:SusC/RagA family TonB-linked outer membrane protein [uncultured Chitinophaga sp.]